MDGIAITTVWMNSACYALWVDFWSSRLQRVHARRQPPGPCPNDCAGDATGSSRRPGGVEIQASGFLYGMVRLLMAQLVSGEHRQTVAQFEERWQQRRRNEVKEAAPARGLCLLRAGYREPIFSQSAGSTASPSSF